MNTKSTTTAALRSDLSDHRSSLCARAASRAAASCPTADLPVSSLACAAVLVALLAVTATGAALVSGLPLHARGAGPTTLVVRSSSTVSPSAAPLPWHLRWLGSSQAVLGLGNGYRDTMGNLETQGKTAYTCYTNYSNGAGGNLYLLSNQSGAWQATQLGTPLTAGTSGDGPGCWVATASWNGKIVSFIAYLLTGDSSAWNDLSNGVAVTYDPSGDLSGPWVNVVAEPPGFHTPGGCCISPSMVTETVFNNATLLIAFQGMPPLWVSGTGGNSAASVVWVVGIPLSALPTTPGGSTSSPWQESVPDAYDYCCGEAPNAPAVNAWQPLILSGSSKVDVVYVRVDTTPGGLPQKDIAQYEGTVLADGNTTWASSSGGVVPDLEATYESVYTTPTVGGGIAGVLLGAGTTFLGVQNASSKSASQGGNGYMGLNVIWGSAPSWQNTTVNEINPGSAVYDTMGATFGACGVTLGDEALADPSASSAQPTVVTYNNSAWTYQTIGPVNVSNQVPNFLEVAAQGQYVDTMFLNQPGGGASGWTTFYTAQALCTNSTLNALAVRATPSTSVDFNNSILLSAQASDENGQPLYAGEGVHISWAMVPSTLATLNSTSGYQVNLTALSTAGTVHLYVNASQYGWMEHTVYTVQVVNPGHAAPQPAGQGGIPPWIPIVIAVVAVASVASYLGFRIMRTRHPTVPSSSSPAAPATPPAPPPAGGTPPAPPPT
ncbi:MAG: hypothetical protein KGJ23_00420 [Euryarchaeota archaeon]|nr:hypothetical protein [Euryarchaeota archaeon]MDE2044899.1 hypothetical protein [Thermoplasmata archaeon]